MVESLYGRDLSKFTKWSQSSDHFLSPTQDSKKSSESVSFIEKSSLHTTNSLQFIKQRNWILSNFPKDTRYETVLISSSSSDNSIGNVLTAQTMQYVRKNDNRAVLTVS